MIENTPALRVLYVEDRAESFDLIREWLKPPDYSLLPRVSSLQVATEVIKKQNPDVLLVDLNLQPGVDDVIKTARFISDLRQSNPRLTILVRSAVNFLRLDVVRVLVSAGISYLLKDSIESREHLDWAIKHARTGGAVYSHRVVKFFNRIVAETTLLTKREMEVAALVAEGLTNPLIAKRLYLAPSRVSELVGNILRKLEFERRAQIAVWYTKQQDLGADSAPDLSAN